MQMVAYQFLQDPGACQLVFAQTSLYLCCHQLDCSETAVPTLPATQQLLHAVLSKLFHVDHHHL